MKETSSGVAFKGKEMGIAVLTHPSSNKKRVCMYSKLLFLEAYAVIMAPSALFSHALRADDSHLLCYIENVNTSEPITLCKA